MRFYNIQFSKTDGTPVFLKSLQGQPLTSLAPNGVFNPGALQIELDVPVYPGSTGDSSATYLKVHGIGLQDVMRQSDWNGLNIAVYGGMSKGLPLATPNQAGLLIRGSIFQCFGNWEGADQSLTFVVGAATGRPDAPVNMPFTWHKGTPLSVALSNVLSIAFPGIPQKIAISPNLVLGYTETGYYRSLKPFAQWLNQRTQPILGGTYRGVHLGYNGNTITAWDGTQAPPSTVQIQPWDLVGQPTWKSLYEITFKTVLRVDISLGSEVILPATIVQKSPTSQSNFRNQTTFNGKLKVQAMHHFGNFRQPTADSWATAVFCAAEPA